MNIKASKKEMPLSLKLFWVLLFEILLFYKLEGKYPPGDQWKAHGSFGQFHLGYAMPYERKLADFLRKDNVLGTSCTLPGKTLSVGSDMTFIRNRCLIGLGGQRSQAKVSAANKGSVTLVYEQLYIRSGYVLCAHTSAIFYGFAGFGLARREFRIQNSSDSSILELGPGNAVLAGKEATYAMNCLSLDMGFEVKKIAVRIQDEIGEERSAGGFCIGIRIGTVLMLPNGKWKTYNASYDLPLGKYLWMPYINLTFGPGGIQED